MSSLPLVTNLDEVLKNIELYNKALANGRLKSIIAYVRDWYAIQDSGKWKFAPSKFIGYSGVSPTIYEKQHNNLDGRATERALDHWFVELPSGHPKEQELLQALRPFVAAQGKSINSLAKMHVLKSSNLAPERLKATTQGQSWRITANPEILGGKPCIRGIRIRVADILEMLAGGATRREILEDFPYLEDGDITAALEYAVASVDHRLIKAA